MSVGRFKYLFSPLKLGRLTLKNRVVFSAHLTNYAEHGLASERHAAYYATRAAGGAGLIITEEHSTHPTDWPYEKLIHGYRPEAVPGYRRITAAVHRYGTPILAQINHNGGQASGLYTRRPVWAPSATPDPLFREVPKAVDAREIDGIHMATPRSPPIAPRAASTASNCNVRIPRSCAASCLRRPTVGKTNMAAASKIACGCCARSFWSFATRSGRTARSASGFAATN